MESDSSNLSKSTKTGEREILDKAIHVMLCDKLIPTLTPFPGHISPIALLL